MKTNVNRSVRESPSIRIKTKVKKVSNKHLQGKFIKEGNNYRFFKKFNKNG